jgi:hypothetical protein
MHNWLKSSAADWISVDFFAENGGVESDTAAAAAGVRRRLVFSQGKCQHKRLPNTIFFSPRARKNN